MYGITSGTFGGWSGVLDVILDPLGYSQSVAAWLGFASTMVSIVGGIAAGYYADRMLLRTGSGERNTRERESERARETTNQQTNQAIHAHTYTYTTHPTLFASSHLTGFRVAMMFLFLLSTICFTWFALVANGILPANLPSLYISTCLGAFAINSSAAMFYEGVVEQTYPAHAFFSTNMLVFAFNGMFLSLGHRN